MNAAGAGVATTGVLIGSFPVESDDQGRKFVWVGQDSSIKFQPTHNVTQVHIKGYVPFSLHAKRNGVTKIVIEVKSAGHMLGQMEFDQDDAFERSFDRGSLSLDQNGRVPVELHSSSVLLHNDVDKRDLGFIITRIAIE